MMNLLYISAAVLIFVFDRLSKVWIMSNVNFGEKFWGIDNVLSFIYVRNEGAAFSILSGKLGFLSIISVLFCIGAVAYWIIKKPKSKLLQTALTLMIAGAAGNAFDRIAYGYVVDFIATEFISFPVFNIADIAITVGAALLVIYAFLDERNTKSD